MAEMMIDTETGPKTLQVDVIDHAVFWAKGADSGIGPYGKPQSKKEDDELLIVLKQAEYKGDVIKGQYARDGLAKLEAAHVRVEYLLPRKAL